MIVLTCVNIRLDNIMLVMVCVYFEFLKDVICQSVIYLFLSFFFSYIYIYAYVYIYTHTCIHAYIYYIRFSLQLYLSSLFSTCSTARGQRVGSTCATHRRVPPITSAFHLISALGNTHVARSPAPVVPSPCFSHHRW